MKRLVAPRAFLVLLWLLQAVEAAGEVRTRAECKLPAPSVIHEAPHELLQTWLLDDSPILESEQLPDNAAFLSFRNEIRKRVSDLNPYSVLQREYDDFMRSGDPVYVGETAKIKVVVAQAAGAIRPMHCLEAALLSVQLERQSMIDQPTEFGAFILKNQDVHPPKLKIYYSTHDTPGGKIDPVMMSMIDTDQSQGWVVWKHLHNHNFFFQGKLSVMGGVCPSKPDVALYLDLLQSRGLQSASITNGFDTIDLTPADFRKLDL
jgi:hypothetical protein